jgi:hypothetical protein
MIKKLYNNFFGNEISQEVLENIKENFYSPAFVTCTFMQYRNDPKEAISHINEIEYLESKKPTIENNEI